MKRIPLVLIFLVLLLFAGRAALPSILKRYVQQTLDKIPEYKSVIGDIDVHLWRGAYAIDDVRLEKASGKVFLPFFKAQRVDISVQWKALIDGALVGELDFEQPVLNFVNGRSKADSQTSADNSWKEAVKKLFPLKFDRVKIRDGEIHYRDPHSDPPVDVYLHDVSLQATNLSNSKKLAKTLIADVDATGKFKKSGTFTMDLRIDPWAETPTFALDTKLENLELTAINDLLRAYGNFDVEQGRFSLFSEVATKGNRFTGYARPILTDVKVLQWRTDSKNPLQAAWEGVVAAVAEIFKNQRHDQIATEIPLRGTFDEPRTELIQTIWGIIYNAFVQALMPGLDNKIDLEDVNDK